MIANEQATATQRPHPMPCLTTALSPSGNRQADGTFRLAEDGWYHLAPFGEFGHPEEQVRQVIDEAAVRAMVARFWQEFPAGWPGLLVDYEHLSHEPRGSTEAAGWIEGLEGRPDGLWAAIRWSQAGRAAVEGGQYRYLSPTWMREECESLPAVNGARRVRPLRLNDAAVTNRPNLRGLTPLSDRAGIDLTPAAPRQPQEAILARAGHGLPPPQPQDPARGAAEGGTCSGQHHSFTGAATTSAPGGKRNHMNDKLLKEIGLPADATTEAAVAAVQALKNRATELEQFNSALLNSQVETDLDQYQDRFRIEARDQWKKALLANRDLALALLKSVVVPLSRTESQGSAVVAPLHNRASAKTPAASAPVAANPETAARQRAEVLAYKNRTGCTFDQAWQAVRAERPELFQQAEG